MQLSVIILNYNVRYFLEQCVLSVQKALEGIDGEIIVIDNASSDDSCEMMKTKFPHIKLIENKDNLGFPKGNNIGVARAKGEYICILNPDTVVAEDTFTKILNTKNWQLNIGIIGCKLIDGAGNFLPESKRGVPTPWVAFTKIFGLYKISNYFGKYYAQHLSENESGKVDILVGAFMMMKRELYLKVGGFDENCFMYSDDIDLSYLVLKTGKSNYYFHETSVIHYKGESTVRDGTYMKRFREAMQFFYKKHFNKSWFFSNASTATMARMPDGFVDLIVTSPPYNMRTRIRNGKYTTREWSEHFSKKYAHFRDDLSIHEYYRQHRRIISEMLRVSSLVL